MAGTCVQGLGVTRGCGTRGWGPGLGTYLDHPGEPDNTLEVIVLGEVAEDPVDEVEAAVRPQGRHICNTTRQRGRACEPLGRCWRDLVAGVCWFGAHSAR